MNLSPEVVAVLGTLGGAFFGGLFGVWAAKVQAKASNERHFKELVVQAATAQWKLKAEYGASNKLLPLEHHIIHAALMCDIALDDESLTPDELRKKLADIRALMDVLTTHAEDVHKAARQG